jgi:hypothetical protein
MRYAKNSSGSWPRRSRVRQSERTVFDYDKLLAPLEKNHWGRYSYAFGEARKDDRLPKCVRYRLKVLEEIVSFHFHPNDEVPYSGVGLNARIHPTPFERFSLRKLRELQVISETVLDRKVSARIHDVLWMSRKQLKLSNSVAIKHAESAIRHLLDIPTDEKDWDYTIDVMNAIRGVRLALSIGNTECLEGFKDKIRLLMRNDHLSDKIAEIVAEWKDPILCQEAMTDLLEKADRYMSNGDQRDAITALEQARGIARLAKCDSLRGRTISERLFLARYALAEQLLKTGAKSIQVEHQFELAYAEWQSLPNDVKHRPDLAKIAELSINQIQKLGIKAVDEMRKVIVVQSVKPRLYPEFEDNLRSDRPPLEKWKLFAALPFALTKADFKRMEDAAKSDIENSIVGCFQRLRKSCDGRTVARTTVPGRRQPAKEREQSFAFAFADRYADRVRTMTSVVLDHLRALRRVAPLDVEQVAHLVQHSKWIPTGHIHQISLAVYYGEQEQWIEAVHLLGPQMEAIVRSRLKEVGVRTIHIKEGVTSELGLSSLSESFPHIVAGPLAFEIQSLFCDQKGSNLRNDIAHGLRNDMSFTPSDVLYAWWLTLHLLLCVEPERNTADGH